MAKINSTISLEIFWFQLFGIWSKSADDLKYRKISRFGHTFNYIVFQILLLTMAYVTEDKNEAIYVILMTMCVYVAFVKMLYLLSGREEILSFLYSAHIDVSSLDSEITREVNKKERIFQKFTDAYLPLLKLCLTGFVITTLPALTTDRKLPFCITFSVDWKYEAVAHWMLHIFMSWTSGLAIIYSSLTIIVWYILYNYNIQYQILGKQFKNLGATKNSRFLRDLIALVKIHRKLFEKVSRFKSFFQNLFLVQVVLSSISISISIFVLAFNSTDNLIATGTYIITVIHVTTDIFAVMHLANEIRLSSGVLSYCLFKSNWTVQSERSKKCLIIVCEFLRQPQELVILNLYPMNLETFTRILNSAYSTFDIIKSLH